jgi:hypothetical protein
MVAGEQSAGNGKRSYGSSWKAITLTTRSMSSIAISQQLRDPGVGELGVNAIIWIVGVGPINTFADSERILPVEPPL